MFRLLSNMRLEILNTINALISDGSVGISMENYNAVPWERMDQFDGFINKHWPHSASIMGIKPTEFCKALLCTEGYSLNHINSIVADKSYFTTAWHYISIYFAKYLGGTN